MMQLCADNEGDFDIWTHAIATAINRKHTQSAAQSRGASGVLSLYYTGGRVLTNDPCALAPVLSHQQLYRQRLLQAQQELEQQQRQQQQEHDEHESAVHTSTAVITPTSSSVEADIALDATRSPTKRPASANPPALKPVPPSIVTSYQHVAVAEPSPWRLEVAVEGTKQCLILGFVVNMVAMKCIASEHVVSKCLVCVVVTAAYVLSIYNPRPRFAVQSARSHHSSSGVTTASDSMSADAAVLHSEASSSALCADPTLCCLHRVAAHSSMPGTGTGASGLVDPSGVHRVTPPGLALKKFAMASSMTRTHMNENGRSTNVPHSWTTSRGESFAVRSLDYKKTRRKEVRPCLV